MTMKMTSRAKECRCNYVRSFTTILFVSTEVLLISTKASITKEDKVT